MGNDKIKHLCYIINIGDDTMIFFWNRKELWVGESLEYLNKLKTILAVSRIEYYTRVVAQRRVRRNRGGIFEGKDLYYLYVNKNEYDKAKHLVSHN